MRVSLLFIFLLAGCTTRNVSPPQTAGIDAAEASASSLTSRINASLSHAEQIEAKAKSLLNE